jgi:hypothetical protein
MISKKKFKKLADKHLTAIERPRNEFGRNEIKIYGLDELYEAINYTLCCKSDSEQLLCRHCDNKKVLHSEATGLCPDRFKHFEAK